MNVIDLAFFRTFFQSEAIQEVTGKAMIEGSKKYDEMAVYSHKDIGCKLELAFSSRHDSSYWREYTCTRVRVIVRLRRGRNSRNELESLDAQGK